MRRSIVVLMVWLVSGCSLSPAIDHNVMDYFEVNDLAANRIILLNILRAKDGAPLHFSELSLVRGQITAGASASASFPFGTLLHATSPRRLANIGGNVSSSPSFDVGSLDTQDFTKGVMTPISAETMKFFLDEGVDYRLVMLLLVSGVRTAGGQELILNAPESAREVCYSEPAGPNTMPSGYVIIAPGDPCPSGSLEPEFFGFLRALNAIPRVYATNYANAPTTVGGPFKLDMRTELRSLAAMDPGKYRLKKLPSGEYQLITAQSHETVVLCQESRTGGSPTVLATLHGEAEAPRVPNDACYARDTGVSEDAPALSRDAMTSGTTMLTLRSTLEVIQYIGRILTFQEQNSHNGADRCVTLGFESHEPGCGGNILFHLQHGGTDSQIGLDYRGQYWDVPASRPCAASAVCDHSLETMAMVALLLNQNKSAKDIPSTPAFQAVP